MTKKILVLCISAFCSLFFFSCPIAYHCDLRFCEFRVENIGIADAKDLRYSPVFTVSNPVGHKISKSVLDHLFVNYPSVTADVIYDIDGVSTWARDEDVFYIIPQELLDVMTPNVWLKRILSGNESDTYEYEGKEYKCKYTKEEFFNFTCPGSAPGYYQNETVYYCIFLGHKPKI